MRPEGGTGVVRAGDKRSDGDYPARRIPPGAMAKGSALTAWGPQAPIKRKNSVEDCESYAAGSKSEGLRPA